VARENAALDELTELLLQRIAAGTGEPQHVASAHLSSAHFGARLHPKNTSAFARGLADSMTYALKASSVFSPKSSV
jgi:hypothetical protein